MFDELFDQLFNYLQIYKSFTYQECSIENCTNYSLLHSGHDVCLSHIECIDGDGYNPNPCNSCMKLIGPIMDGDELYWDLISRWKLHLNFVSTKSSLTLPLKWNDEELKNFFESLCAQLSRCKAYKVTSFILFFNSGMTDVLNISSL